MDVLGARTNLLPTLSFPKAQFITLCTAFHTFPINTTCSGWQKKILCFCNCLLKNALILKHICYSWGWKCIWFGINGTFQLFQGISHYEIKFFFFLAQRAGVPMFSITNNPNEVRLQMYILDFIQRMEHTPS